MVKFFFLDSSLWTFTNKDNKPERNYKARKRRVPESKRNQEEQEMEYNSDSERPQEPVRRSARARSKVSYKVGDAME